MDKETPDYNFHGQCMNSEEVLELFDSFEQAKSISNILNINLRRESIFIDFSRDDWQEKYARDLEEFNKRLAVYEDFEQALIFLENSMEITEEPVLSDIILSR